MPFRLVAGPSTEALTYGLAGIGALAPLYLLLPGATERLATQTARWAPRWERNISYFKPPVEWGMKRITPPVERTVQRIGHHVQPRLEKTAKGLSRQIEKRIGSAKQ
jgi:hypothetical protein